MKKLSIILVVLLLLTTLAGCSTSEKAQERAVEKSIEDAMGDVEVNIDGDKYTYEDKDGNKMEVGGTQWPTDKAAEFIPKFDEGMIIGCTIMGNIYLIDVEKVEQGDYDSYLQRVKDAGFTEDVFTIDVTDTDEYYQYQATDKNGNGMTLSYEATIKKLQIMGTAAVKE